MRLTFALLRSLPFLFLAPTAFAQNGSYVEQIYAQLNKLFQGSENQVMCMEFPGRILNIDTYAYETGSVFSEITKPQPVIEAEFVLSDNLFGASQITGGPTGMSLAETYKNTLNMLVPLAVPGAFDEEQDQIREWLLDEVSQTIDDQVVTMTRMELFELLNDRYLEARRDWKRRRLDNLRDALDSDDVDRGLDDFARDLAHEGVVQEARLANLYDDLIVRGDYHKVRAALGYLDLQLPSGALEHAKDRMRDSEMLSLDESRTIYPVRFQPTNWFKSLRTDFAPTDLLMDPEVIQDQIFEKQQHLEELKSQFAQLLARETGDPEALRDSLAAAQNRLGSAQSNQIRQFSESTITIAKWAIDAYLGQNEADRKAMEDSLEAADASASEADETALQALFDDAEDAALDKANEKIESKGGNPLTDEQWDQLKEFQNEIIDAQSQVTTASRALTDALVRQAEAEATESGQARLILESQMTRLRREIEAMKEVLFAKTPELDPAPELRITPDLHPDSKPSVGEWMDVIINASSNSNRTESSLVTSAEQTSWEVDFIIGSAGGQSTSQSSTSSFSNDSDSYSIDIGFRATKVTIDRGWFSPEIFRMTQAMWKLQDISISEGPPEDTLTASEARRLNSAYFPAYPVAFVIVKDVTIKIKSTSDETKSMKSFLDERSSASGGVLCFSVSHSSASRSNEQSMYTGHSSDGLIIRIPGPQILAWFLEFVPEDRSRLFDPTNPESHVSGMFGRAVPETEPVDIDERPGR